MNLDEMTIEELNARKAELDEQIKNLNLSRGLIEENLFKRQEIPTHASWVGKCYSYKNSYGGGSDIADWMEYQRIESFDAENDCFMVLTIYTRENETSITKALDYPLHFESGYRKECEPSVFEENYSKIKLILGIS